MASKTGVFLDEDERDRLIRGLQDHGEVQRSHIEPLGNDTGCLICGKDDDHNNLMLCESCNDEYHTYCLDPPLSAVPRDDWYCDRCTGRTIERKRKIDSDGLSDRVIALPPGFTSRFGEVCFAYGGFGFGWWPSCIFDPRLTEGGARQSARKNLGKKHLIYFFECHETPFAVLSTSKIVPWYEGLAENYHLGKTAKAAGKQRWMQFQQALQAAVIEEGKPIEQRMDWNRGEDQPQLLPLPKKSKKGPKDADHLSPIKKTKSRTKQKKKKTPLYCRILKKSSAEDAGTNVGFVKLSSARKATFADARTAIEKELIPEAIPRAAKWKFHVTTLGPVSLKQEESLGPLLPFLRSGIGGNATNGGSIEDPITVVILMEEESKPPSTAAIKK